jgi:hypothetical protein
MPGGGSALRVGQAVTLAEGSWGWRLTAQPAGRPGHQVVAVGADHVVLADPDTGATTRLPLYLIEAVVVPAETAQGEAA